MNEGNENERQMQKIALEMNYYKAQAEEVQNQMRSLNMMIQENDAARETLKALNEHQENLFQRKL